MYVVTESRFCSRCGLARTYSLRSFPTRGARTRGPGQDDAPRARAAAPHGAPCSGDGVGPRLQTPAPTGQFGAEACRNAFLEQNHAEICHGFCLFLFSLYTSQSKGAKQTSQHLIDVFGSVTVRGDPNGLSDFRSGSVMGTGNTCFANITSSSVIMGRTENPGRRRQSNLPAPLSPDRVFCCGETLLSLGAAQSRGAFCLVFLIFSWRNPSSQATKGSKLLVLFEEC